MVDIKTLDWYEQIALVLSVDNYEDLSDIMKQLSSVPTWLIYPMCVVCAKYGLFPLKISQRDICLFAGSVLWPESVVMCLVAWAFDKKATSPNRFVMLDHLCKTQRTTLHNLLTEYAYIAQRTTERMRADGMSDTLITMLREVAVAEGMGRFLPP
jgi:hypothetical protein